AAVGEEVQRLLDRGEEGLEVTDGHAGGNVNRAHRWQKARKGAVHPRLERLIAETVQESVDGVGGGAVGGAPVVEPRALAALAELAGDRAEQQSRVDSCDQ